MGKKWIKEDAFEKIEVDTKVETRFMGNGITIQAPIDDEIRVLMLDGPWKDQELMLIRQQIERLL